ncbi:MAG TPA: DUF3558 domain-containing protein [Amycolatopsis sp.]|nr:DUF3558 domain-containing protein [Amycolatopsis sp.]
MPHRTVRLTAAAIAAFGLLTACSGGTGGNAEAPTSASSSNAPDGGAGPKVPAPLPAQDLLNDPCTALNASEASQVGLAYPGSKVTEGLVSCRFTSSGSDQNFVHVTPVPQNNGGISDIYSQKSKQAYFEPASIDGYPAVYADTQDGRTSGTCTLWVGVTDQLAVSVIPQIGTGRNRNDPCGVAKSFATAMIQHLKGAA